MRYIHENSQFINDIRVIGSTGIPLREGIDKEEGQ